MGRKKVPKEERLVPIIFKVTPAILKELEGFAKTQQDEMGKTLTAPVAARRLVLLGLKGIRPKKG